MQYISTFQSSTAIAVVRVFFYSQPRTSFEAIINLTAIAVGKKLNSGNAKYFRSNLRSRKQNDLSEVRSTSIYNSYGQSP